MSSSGILTLNDMEVMEQIIRVCQSRGAFRPEEMVHTGILYNKLVEFIRNAKEQQLLAAKTSSASSMPSTPSMPSEPNFPNFGSVSSSSSPSSLPSQKSFSLPTIQE